MTGENKGSEPEYQEEIGPDVDLDADNQVVGSKDSENSYQKKLSEISEKFKSKVNSILHKKKDSSTGLEGEVEMVDEVSNIYQDLEIMRESLEDKIDTEVELLSEEIDEVIGNSDKSLEDLEVELKNKVENTKEDLKGEIDSVNEDIESIEDEIEKLVEVINSKVDKSQHEELDRLKGLGDKVEEIENRLDQKADSSKVNDIQEVQNMLSQRMESKMNKYDMDSSGESLKENLTILEKEVEKLAVGDDSDPIQPSEVTEDMIGNYVEVKGVAEFKKEIDDEYLSILKGRKGEVPVKSKRKLGEEEIVVKGSVKNADGFLFVQSV